MFHKTVSLLGILACISVFPANAQRNFFANTDRDIPKIFFGGLQVGMNISQLDGDGYGGYHKVGLNVGPLMYVRFSDHIGSSIAFTYSQKGSTNKNYSENLYGIGYLDEYYVKLNYVEVPLLLHYFSDQRYNIGAGASYARLINSKEEAYTVAQVNLDPELYPFLKNEWSWMIDANYEFYKGWFIGARYSYTLGTVREPQYIPEYYGGGRFGAQRNNVVSFKLTYLFH